MQDVVILNKIDLVLQEDVTSTAVEELEKEIYNINPLANVIRSVRCLVDLCKILDRQAYGAKVWSCMLDISIEFYGTVVKFDYYLLIYLIRI